MILLALETLLLLWLCWVLFHFAMIGAVSFIVTPDAPCYTGLRIVMPSRLRDILTREEFGAVLAHELGHKHHMHVWKNFARRCCCLPVNAARIQAQEREADLYAIWLGYGPWLDSARAKMRGSRA